MKPLLKILLSDFTLFRECQHSQVTWQNISTLITVFLGHPFIKYVVKHFYNDNFLGAGREDNRKVNSRKDTEGRKAAMAAFAGEVDTGEG